MHAGGADYSPGRAVQNPGDDKFTDRKLKEMIAFAKGVSR
jgi:hypothetical protein